MTLGQFLALGCLVMAVIAGVADKDILFNAVEWLVAAIAVMLTLGGTAVPVIGPKKQAG